MRQPLDGDGVRAHGMRMAETGMEGAAEERAGPSGPVWRRIASDLAAGISEHRYREGEPLPTALALAGRYGVHRHTVRQAFRHLQEQGLVSVEQGRGTFVTGGRLPYRLGRRVRLRDNAERAGVAAESAVLGRAVEPATDAVAGALGLAPGTPVVRLVSASTAAGAPLSRSIHWLESSRFPDFDIASGGASGSFTAEMRRHGVEDYIRASTCITARGADETEAEALGIAPGAPVLVSRALDATTDGAPFHLVESVFAGARVEFIVGED